VLFSFLIFSFAGVWEMELILPSKEKKTYQVDYDVFVVPGLPRDVNCDVKGEESNQSEKILFCRHGNYTFLNAFICGGPKNGMQFYGKDRKPYTLFMSCKK